MGLAAIGTGFLSGVMETLHTANVLKTHELHFDMVDFVLCELWLSYMALHCHQKGQRNGASPRSWQRFSTGRPELALLVMKR